MDKEKRVKINKELLRNEIQEKRKSQAFLSRELGYADTYLCKILNSDNPGELVEKDEKMLCYMLGVKPGYFIERLEPQKNLKPIAEENHDFKNLENKIDILLRGMDKIDKTSHEILDSIEAVRSKVNANTIQMEKIKQGITQQTKTEKDRAIEFLRNILKDGRMSGPEVLNAADNYGIKRATVMEARKEIGVEIETTGYGKSQKSYWYIPR